MLPVSDFASETKAYFILKSAQTKKCVHPEGGYANKDGVLVLFANECNSGTRIHMYIDQVDPPSTSGGCGEIISHGYWTIIGRPNAAVGYTISKTEGYTSTSSRSKSTSWTKAFTKSTETGFTFSVSKSGEVQTGATKMGSSVQAEFSSSILLSSTQSTSATELVADQEGKTASQRETWNFLKSGTAWQWNQIGVDLCGSAQVRTHDFAITGADAQPPCCPPGQFHDNLSGEHRMCACVALCATPFQDVRLTIMQVAMGGHLFAMTTIGVLG